MYDADRFRGRYIVQHDHAMIGISLYHCYALFLSNLLFVNGAKASFLSSLNRVGINREMVSV